jgi:hypothetical protein
MRVRAKENRCILSVESGLTDGGSTTHIMILTRGVSLAGTSSPQEDSIGGKEVEGLIMAAEGSRQVEEHLAGATTKILEPG